MRFAVSAQPAGSRLLLWWSDLGVLSDLAGVESDVTDLFYCPRQG